MAPWAAPVYIPKIYNGKNKTFFFATYQGFRNRAGRNIQTPTIPTAANYEGDFRGWTRSGVMAPIYDPASTRLAPSGSGYVRDLFPNNIIPQNRFSGVATRFIALRPADMVPTNTGNSFGDPVKNYVTDSGSTSSPWDKGSIRIDHHSELQEPPVRAVPEGPERGGFGADGAPGLPVPFNGGAVTTTQQPVAPRQPGYHVQPAHHQHVPRELSEGSRRREHAQLRSVVQMQ